MKKPKIGIVGIGILGGAMLSWYEKNDYEVVTFDTEKECTGKDSFEDANIIFVCVPTPYRNGSCDLSALEKTFDWLPDGKLVIIRSTVPPGTTQKYAKEYLGRIAFNPEFLDASKSEYDFEFPERQIIGITQSKIVNSIPSDNYLESIFEHLPVANRNYMMDSTQAECVKYMGNSFFALKNVFVNMWYDYCLKNGIEFDSVRQAFGDEPRIGHVHTHPVHKGARGAGGSCLPKDLAATIDFMRGSDVDSSFLEYAKKINDKRLEDNNKIDFLGMYEK